MTKQFYLGCARFTSKTIILFHVNFTNQLSSRGSSANSTDFIVVFGTRSKPAILLPICEHDTSHGLETQWLVNNFKPSRRCIVPFPVIIQPDECHVNHRKQREIRLARSR